MRNSVSGFCLGTLITLIIMISLILFIKKGDKSGYIPSYLPY